jgi:hypothetical protein
MRLNEMEYMKFRAIAALSFMTFSIAFATTMFLTSQPQAQATGGVGEIKDLIDPIVDRAITALQNNNTEAALEEIQTLKGELADTYSLEEEEESEDDDKKKKK